LRNILHLFLIFTLYNNVVDQRGVDHMTEQMNRVLEYIEHSLQEEINLTKLAERFHYSKTHLSRMFNLHVGMNLADYINRRRLSVIAVEILKQSKSIGYLANIHGYNSQKYFSKLFKSTFMVTPSTYKKRKKFIVLQGMRILKGEQTMRINDVNELSYHVWSQSVDENTMRDTLESIENAILYEKKESGVTFLTYIDEGEYTCIYEIILNLINGSYEKRHVFYVENKLHTLKRFLQEEDEFAVVFEDKDTKKNLKAYFKQGHQPYVVFQTNTVDGYKFDEEVEDEVNQDTLNALVEKLKNRLKSCMNAEEIKKLCEQEDNLVLMRYFDYEFVLVKLVRQGNFFMLVSIYLDMRRTFAESYYFFGSRTKANKVFIQKNEHILELYMDDQLFAKSYILGGNEKISQIHIEFPSGMSGSGGWDFSDEFDIE